MTTKTCPLVAQMVKNLAAVKETGVWSLGREYPLEKRMATHSSIPAWRIPFFPGDWQLSSMRLQKLDTTEWLTLSFIFHQDL